MDWAKTTARRDENHLRFVIWCLFYSTFYGRSGSKTPPWLHDDVIHCVTGPLCGEVTGHWWIPLTKASDPELSCFFDLRLNKRLSKQSRRRWLGTPSCSLWRHRKEYLKCRENLLVLNPFKCCNELTKTYLENMLASETWGYFYDHGLT